MKKNNLKVVKIDKNKSFPHLEATKDGFSQTNNHAMSYIKELN